MISETLTSGFAALSLLGAPPSPPPVDEGFTASDLVLFAHRYCIEPDGDRARTIELAQRDGFTPLLAEDFPRLRLPAARDLRGLTKTIDGAEIRVLTAKNWLRGAANGQTFFHICWVSASPANRRAVDAALSASLHVRRIRQERAFLYAWFPQADGSRRSVRRKTYDLRGHALAREEGMRMVISNAVGPMVAIAYMRAVEQCDACTLDTVEQAISLNFNAPAADPALH